MAGKTKNHMWLDTSGMKRWIEELDKVSDDLEDIVERALEEVAQTIQSDVKEGMQKAHLPKRGKYATGQTESTILENPKVKWEGGVARIAVGFDQMKPGASVFLITGVKGDGGVTGDPRMEPNPVLKKIFRQKKYMDARQKELIIFLQDELEQLTGELIVG